MFPDDRDYLARKERYEALRQEAEYERLIKAGRRRPVGQPGWPGQITAWAGQQLVTWGSKLQRYSGLNQKVSEPVGRFKELAKTTDQVF